MYMLQANFAKPRKSVSTTELSAMSDRFGIIGLIWNYHINSINNYYLLIELSI